MFCVKVLIKAQNLIKNILKYNTLFLIFNALLIHFTIFVCLSYFMSEKNFNLPKILLFLSLSIKIKIRSSSFQDGFIIESLFFFFFERPNSSTIY